MCEERKIGGDRYCRICGFHVPLMHNCGKPSPLQEVQMAIEKTEEFFANVPVINNWRPVLKNLFLELRKSLQVPLDRIYARSPIVTGCDYKIPKKVIEAIIEVFIGRINGIGKTSTAVTEGQYSELQSVMELLRSKILKIPN